MPYKIKITAVATLTEGFGSLKIRIRQLTKIYHIGMAKHRPPTMHHIFTDMCIKPYAMLHPIG